MLFSTISTVFLQEWKCWIISPTAFTIIFRQIWIFKKSCNNVLSIHFFSGCNPPILANDTALLTPLSDWYTINEKVGIYCADKTLTLVGNNSMTCGDNETWIGEPPVCLFYGVYYLIPIISDLVVRISDPFCVSNLFSRHVKTTRSYLTFEQNWVFLFQVKSKKHNSKFS